MPAGSIYFGQGPLHREGSRKYLLRSNVIFFVQARTIFRRIKYGASLPEHQKSLCSSPSRFSGNTAALFKDSMSRAHTDAIAMLGPAFATDAGPSPTRLCSSSTTHLVRIQDGIGLWDPKHSSLESLRPPAARWQDIVGWSGFSDDLNVCQDPAP